MHHLIFLMPVLGLVIFWLLPPALAVPIYAVVLGGSVLAYIAVARVMRRPALMGPHELEHAPAEVVLRVVVARDARQDRG
jgi:hypothetical protein